MCGEACRQGRIRRERQLLVGPLTVQVFLGEAVLAVVVRRFDAKAVVSRRDTEPSRLHNALGSRDLGGAAGRTFGAGGGFCDAAQGRELFGRHVFLTFSAYNSAPVAWSAKRWPKSTCMVINW